MSTPLQVVIGNRDLTGRHEGLTFSNVDPGGYEAATLRVDDPYGIYPGAEMTVRHGLEWAWHGRVNEAAPRIEDGRRLVEVSAVGYGAGLSDGTIREIYVDRDLSGWRAVSIQRRLDLAAAFPVRADSTVGPDMATGNPAVVLQLTAMTNAGSVREMAAGHYDSPVLIDSVYYDVITRDLVADAELSGGSWTAEVTLGSDDTMGVQDTSGNVAPSGSGYVSATGDRNAAEVHLYLDAVFTGDGNWNAFFRKLAVYGDHGLTKRGTDPGGFYPSDIAADVYDRAGFTALLVPTDTSYIAPHVVYRDPVPYEQVLDDMATLMGFHWGVWEPVGILGTEPVGWFVARPPSPTCYVSLADCSDVAAPSVRLDALYDRAEVAYRDAAGTAGLATATISNPLLAQAGVGSRTLALNMGLGDETAAETLGETALALALASARGGGSVTVPTTVGVPGGGRKPACLLKSGRDRLRITDLPDAGPVTGSDSERTDTFRIRRVETTQTAEGVISTRVEFDGGADLLEVLTARLAAAQVVAGG